MSSKTTLIIADDHKLIADMWASVLTSSGVASVETKVTNCRELLEKTKEIKPDIVLLDILLADGSSLDYVKELKKLSPKTKYLVVSAYTDLATIKQSFALGVDGYLTKTSSLQEITEAITEVKNGKKFQCREVQDLISTVFLEDKQTLIGNKKRVELTKKEKEIAYLIYKGLSAKDIAAKLGVSSKTVDVHRHHIYQKLGIKKLSRLIWYVQENQHLFSNVSGMS
jgi:DNA-binding NarL/FixJ family response regulator